MIRVVKCETTQAAAAPEQNSRSDDDLRAKIPAYTRIGGFLVSTLKSELLAANSSTADDERSKAFKRFNSVQEVLTALKQQFEAYTPQEGLFKASSTIKSPREYWRELRNNVSTCIMTVCG